VTRLRKADVRRMLERFDRDPVGALTVALAAILEISAPDWNQLVALCGFAPDRVDALQRGDQRALDQLAVDLNELRSLPA
jgi:hypothetical protein